jgi:hypothetical protein
VQSATLDGPTLRRCGQRRGNLQDPRACSHRSSQGRGSVLSAATCSLNSDCCTRPPSSVPPSFLTARAHCLLLFSVIRPTYRTDTPRKPPPFPSVTMHRHSVRQSCTPPRNTHSIVRTHVDRLYSLSYLVQRSRKPRHRSAPGTRVRFPCVVSLFGSL